MAYAVAQRTTEIGVRMALGATPSEIFRLVVGDGLKLTGTGVVIGSVASLIVARWLTTLLFDVRPGDPRTLAATAGVLLVVALACFCRRAARRGWIRWWRFARNNGVEATRLRASRYGGARATCPVRTWL